MATPETQTGFTAWLQGISYGSEEHNGTAGQRNAQFGASTPPLNRGSSHSTHRADASRRGVRRQVYSDSQSPSGARFAPSPSRAPAAPPPGYSNLFTLSDERFTTWVNTQAPPESVTQALLRIQNAHD